jgi:hypothetical protein
MYIAPVVSSDDRRQERIKMKWTVVPTVAFGLIAGGCADIGSEDIRTSGICATITASNDSNNKVIVETELTAGCGLGGSYVVLGSGESLTTSYMSQNYTLSRHTDILTNITSYSATTNLDYRAGEQITVALNRPSDYVSATNSYVMLPSEFSITTPSASNTSYSLSSGDTITVVWTGASTTDSILFNLTCQAAGTGDTVHATISRSPDQTTPSPFTITMADMDSILNDPNDSIDDVSSCNKGTVSVIRSVTGSADPALDLDSRIRGKFKVSRDISLSF